MGSGTKIPKIPSASKEFEKGLQIWRQNLPKMLQQEFDIRNKWDPALTLQALNLQSQFDPRLAQEQLGALQRRDQEWYNAHQVLGDKIRAALDRGYLDPRQEAAYGKLAATAGRLDPTRTAEYRALGDQITSDTLRGGTADPETLRQMTQAIMSRSPNLSYGEAQDMAAAVYTGQRAQALKAQRQQAGQQFLTQVTPQQQREASLAGFYGMAPPVAQTFAQAGSYLSSPTVSQMINQVSGVTPPSNFRYENPNAGYMEQQYGLQNYQNRMAYAQMGGGQGSGNPWMNALQGAGQGASMGSIGGPYGMAGGAVVGGVLGGLGYPQFSDARLKKNISRTGAFTADGIPISEFSFVGSDTRFRGVIAQDVIKVRPDAVVRQFVDMVDYEKLGLKLEEVK